MLLVFIFVIIFFIIVFILSCNIKLNISISDRGYRIMIYVFIFRKFCIYRINSNQLLKRINKKSYKIGDSKFILKFIKNLNIRADKLYAKLYVSTAEVQSTALISGILNNIITFLLLSLNVKITKNKIKYKVIPIYSSKKIFHVKFKCIFSISLVHIISTFIRTKIGDEINGRKSSNRRAYGYRHE